MDEVMSKNNKKVWTTISTRIPQSKKAEFLKAANAVGMNTNQFIAKLILDYLEDGREVDDKRVAEKLFDLMMDFKAQVVRLEGQKAKVERELIKRKILLKELPTDTILPLLDYEHEELMRVQIDGEVTDALKNLEE